MKIALIGPTYPFRGGISHYTTLLHEHLKERHEVRFFSFSRQYPKWLFPGKSDVDPSQMHIQVPGVERVIDSVNPLTWVHTARILARNGFDVVIIPWWVSFWAPQFFTILKILKKYSNTLILFICHNVVAHESKSYDKLLTKLVLKQGDYYIVHSREDENNLLDILPDARVCRHVHPTYDVFRFDDFEPQECRRMLGVSGNLMLFFGFVRDYKGLTYLLKAMPEILAAVPVKLMVVGEFWKDKHYYLKLIEQLDVGDHVIIIDQYVPNEDVGRYFCAADLVVQPYVSATGSGVVQIAFGFHKPVLATAVGCLPEIIDHGRTGFIVPPKSPEAIAEAAINLFTSKSKGFFEENIKRQQYRFSWERLADKIEMLLADGIQYH